jgi:tetratricopeptide (TPR) repeat protein
MLGEVFLHDGNFEVAQRFLLSDVRKNPKMYPATMKMLQQLIERADLSACLEVVDALFEISIQQHDEMNLKIKLDSMLKMNPNDTRILKTLTTRLIRTKDRENLETLLKQLAILQLQSGNLREAKESFSKMVIYAQNSLYLDLLNELNDAIIDGMHDVQRETCQKVVRALERGSLDQEENQGDVGLALGVTDLDLGLGLEIQIGDELFTESPG